MVFGPGSMPPAIVVVLAAFPVVRVVALGNSAGVEAGRSAYCVGVGPGSLEVVAGLCDRVPVEALGTDPREEGVLGTRAGVVCSLRVVVVGVPGVGAVVGCACVLEEADREVLVTPSAASATTG